MADCEYGGVSVLVCLSVRVGRHQRGQRFLWALHQSWLGGFHNEKNIDADNELDNVNNINHPHNGGSNKT